MTLSSILSHIYSPSKYITPRQNVLPFKITKSSVRRLRIKMFVGCTCTYAAFVDESGSPWTTGLELLLSFFIGALGIKLNYRFLKKLEDERRHTPLGRKGNVIEPIMRWFCWIQIVYWPYHLLFYWINFNGIVPVEWMNGWWCNIIFQIGIVFGRYCIAYNSLFVALIRYIYIVHHKRANQWSYERVGNMFRYCSVAVPLSLFIIGMFTAYYPLIEAMKITEMAKFKDCFASYQGLNATEDIPPFMSVHTKWTLNYLPESLVIVMCYIHKVITAIVFLNLADIFFYVSIYRSVTR